MTKNNMQTNEFPLNFEYSDFHKGDFVMDAHHGTKWHVIFFHIDNWIPIATYLASAVLFGMYRDNQTKESLHE